MSTAHGALYTAAWVALCALAVALTARSPRAETLRSQGYRRLLLAPWRLATGALATLFLVAAAPYANDPTWDRPVGLFMGVLTYATAPWSVGALVRVLRGPAPAATPRRRGVRVALLRELVVRPLQLRPTGCVPRVVGGQPRRVVGALRARGALLEPRPPARKRRDLRLPARGLARAPRRGRRSAHRAPGAGVRGLRGGAAAALRAGRRPRASGRRSVGPSPGPSTSMLAAWAEREAVGPVPACLRAPLDTPPAGRPSARSSRDSVAPR